MKNRNDERIFISSLHSSISGQKAVETRSFLFLRKELPVRLANIMKEINLLPEKLQSMPSVALVEKWYEMSFDEILQFENKPGDDPRELKRLV
jgi:pyruvate dehydrogenase kinase 2/3/4